MIPEEIITSIIFANLVWTKKIDKMVFCYAKAMIEYPEKRFIIMEDANKYLFSLPAKNIYIPKFPKGGKTIKGRELGLSAISSEYKIIDKKLTCKIFNH